MASFYTPTPPVLPLHFSFVCPRPALYASHTVTRKRLMLMSLECQGPQAHRILLVFFHHPLLRYRRQTDPGCPHATALNIDHPCVLCSGSVARK
jgi:hypothetical protein